MILDLLKSRYSARVFKEQAIEPQDIADIIEAGRLSPSGGNEQPWQFLVVNQADKIEALSEACYSQSWIRTAPLAIVLCVEPVGDDRGCRNIQCAKFKNFKEAIETMPKELFDALNQEEHQTKIAGSQMALVALEKGIYSTWVSYYNVQEVIELFNIPKHLCPSDILIFGYPKQEGHMRAKKNADDIVHYNQF